MSLSLRDIEHCVRFAALVVSKWQLDPISIVRDYDKVSTEDVYDAVMAIIVVRLQDEELYNRFVLYRKFARDDNIVNDIMKFLREESGRLHDPRLQGVEQALKAMFDESSKWTYLQIVALIDLVFRLLSDRRSGGH